MMKLDDALQAVAAPDDAFCGGGITITPRTTPWGIDYSVDVGDAEWYAGDMIGWTYADGLDLAYGNAEHAREWTRLFEPFESWDCPVHVCYNMDAAVEALRDGYAVTFQYAIVTDTTLVWDDAEQVYYDQDGETVSDDIVGWIVLAFWEE